MLKVFGYHLLKSGNLFCFIFAKLQVCRYVLMRVCLYACMYVCLPALVYHVYILFVYVCICVHLHMYMIYALITCQQ